MFEDLLRLNALAAAEKNYETAYHLLMAALHWADCVGDQTVLQGLAALAKTQGAEVECVDPPHHLSRKMAQVRGQTALYESYLTHVEAVRLRLEAARERDRRRAARGSGA